MQPACGLWETFLYRSKGDEREGTHLQSKLVTIFSFRVWAEWFTNGSDADISCSKPVNIACIQSWGMRYKGGTAECREIGRLTPRRPTNHRPHRLRFSFAIIFCSRLFHSKLDFGKPTQKSDRLEANVRTDTLVTMKILSNPYLRDFCFTT